MILIINNKKQVLSWLFSGIILVFSMIAIGGITRLTESGLSITEWNVIMGAIPPMNETDWQAAFDKYKQSPEYIHKNFDFTLEDFKFIYWWEWIHRQLGRIIGMAFLIPFLYFLIKKSFTPKAIQRLLIIFLVGGIQGFLGWYMVSSGLVKEPRVSHYRLAMHLCTALLTISLIGWLILDIIAQHKNKTSLSGNLRKHFLFGWVTLGVITIQIIYGAFVAGLDAGQIHNTWPTMDGQWIHQGVMMQGFPDALHNSNSITTIQFIHRWWAMVVVLCIGGLWFSARRFKYLQKHHWLGLHIMMGGVIIQFLLGVFTLIYHVPISLGLMHQLGAVIVLLSTLHHLHSLKYTM
ncbi:MAG: COX15/CtaA family protein [Flavobacteriales bacterium]|nr:COX15/CtaA family protein [Flavobacteriales bacterium]